MSKPKTYFVPKQGDKNNDIGEIERGWDSSYRKNITSIKLREPWETPLPQPLPKLVERSLPQYVEESYLVGFDEIWYLRLFKEQNLVNLVRITPIFSGGYESNESISRLEIFSQLIPDEGLDRWAPEKIVKTQQLPKQRLNMNKEGIDGDTGTLIYYTLSKGETFEDMVKKIIKERYFMYPTTLGRVSQIKADDYNPYAEIINPTSKRVKSAIKPFSEFVNLIEEHKGRLCKIEELLTSANRLSTDKDIIRYEGEVTIHIPFEILDKKLRERYTVSINTKKMLQDEILENGTKLWEQIKVPNEVKSLDELLRGGY